MDLCSSEEGDLVPRVTVATVSGGEDMVLVELHNRIHHERLAELLVAGREAAANVRPFLRSSDESCFGQTRCRDCIVFLF